MNHLSCRSVPGKWPGVQWCAGQCFIPICHICFPRLKSTVKDEERSATECSDFTIKTPVQGAAEDGLFFQSWVQFLASTWCLTIIRSYSFRAPNGFMGTEPAHGIHSNLQAKPSWAYNKWKSLRKEIHSREDHVLEQNSEEKCLPTSVKTNKHFRRLGSDTCSTKQVQAKRPVSAPTLKKSPLFHITWHTKSTGGFPVASVLSSWQRLRALFDPLRQEGAAQTSKEPFLSLGCFNIKWARKKNPQLWRVLDRSEGRVVIKES